MANIGKILLTLIVLAVVLLFGILVSALLIGLIGAVFLETPWRVGYDRAWERWGWTLVFWFFLFSSIFGGRDR